MADRRGALTVVHVAKVLLGAVEVLMGTVKALVGALEVLVGAVKVLVGAVNSPVGVLKDLLTVGLLLFNDDLDPHDMTAVRGTGAGVLPLLLLLGVCVVLILRAVVLHLHAIVLVLHVVLVLQSVIFLDAILERLGTPVFHNGQHCG